MLNQKRLWRKHKLEISFGVITVIAALFSHSDIQRSMQGLSEDRARIASNASEQRRLEENAELVKAKAAIAEQRYNSGCTLVVSVSSPRNLATLVLVGRCFSWSEGSAPFTFTTVEHMFNICRTIVTLTLRGTSVEQVNNSLLCLT